MYAETKPILFNCPKEYDTVEIYPVHDLHYGSEQFNLRKWNALHDLILDAPNRFIVWVGDLMENAVPFSNHSDCLTQMYSPQEQKEYITALFKEFKRRTIAILDGNHELNRSTRMAGLYPLYDCACIAGIPEQYRSAYAVMDIGVGTDSHYMKGRQTHYVGFAAHRAKSLKFLSDRPRPRSDRPPAWKNNLRFAESCRIVQISRSAELRIVPILWRVWRTGRIQAKVGQTVQTCHARRRKADRNCRILFIM